MALTSPTRLPAAALVGVLGLGAAVLLAGDAATVGTGRPTTDALDAARAAWTEANWNEVKWPFPIDQWGTGRAFQCSASACGTEIDLYLRAKLGFCNCATGVSDDAELDRVGDLELLSGKFEGLHDGRAIDVGWMKGRSRPYRVAVPYGGSRTALAIAFNDKCDVVVTTVVAEAGRVPEAEAAALAFLNGDLVLRWVEKELGL
jgi:hypothetical protein